MKRALLAAMILLSGCGSSSKPDPAGGLLAGTLLPYTVDLAARAYGKPASGQTFVGCPDYSPFTETDLDGWPDVSTTFTYTACVRGSATIDGTISVLDGNVGSRSMDVSSTSNLSLHVVGAGSDWTGVVSGVRGGSGTSTPWSVVDGNGAGGVTTTVANGNFGAQGVHDLVTVSALTLLYAPAGAWLPGDSLLVAGLLAVSGPWSYRIDGALSGTNVSTVAPLALDPTCPDTIIRSGEIKADGSGGSIHVKWTNCSATVSVK